MPCNRAGPRVVLPAFGRCLRDIPYSFSKYSHCFCLCRLRYGICLYSGMSKLLVIDDCKIHHFIIDRILGKHGLFEEKRFYYDAETAINQLEDDCLDEAKLPDVIFLDLVMPQFNGFSFLDRFKKLYPAIEKTIHVFILSCSIDPADKMRSEKYPFVKGFIVKPLTTDTLKNIGLAYSSSLQLT